MNLKNIREDRQKWHFWKNIKPLRETLSKLPHIENITYTLDDCIRLDSPKISDTDKIIIKNFAWDLRPWRKGPFELFGTFIDSEWQSFIKYNIIKKHFTLKDKLVADIGCNNGYYLFRMLKENPKKLVGFDPSVHYKTQFDFINHFLQSKITYELLGIEHLPYYETKFDLIFCLGVLYHRSDPVSALKALNAGLNNNGEVILDTFIIDGEEETALCPRERYSKIPNIYFIPTLKALKNWCIKAKFKDFELLDIKITDINEQRKTEWIQGESLENFLDPKNHNLTIEGYPAPKRAYVKIKK